MREIKFRGRVIAPNEHYKVGDWVYGDLLLRHYHDGGYAYISYFFDEYHGGIVAVETVDQFGNGKDTIGQFTGLYDKNGKEIYEGDVVKLFYYDGSSKDQLGNVKGIDNIIFVDGCFKLENETKYHPIGYDILGKCRFTEVIGNIHESVVSL